MGDDPKREQKRAAAERAVEWVEPGMTVGLGTGSTAVWAIRSLGERLADGRLRDIVAIPTSNASAAEARAVGVPLVTFDSRTVIDITIDGADEVDPALNLVKGYGGALLREKVVAQATRREVIVVDDSKPSERLGTRCHVPVEVLRFAAAVEREFLQSLGAEVVLRPDGTGPFVTDEGNWILDVAFGPIGDVDDLAARLQARAGIVEHGLFLGLAHDLLIATDHTVEHRSAPART
ncbi:MAG: ribose-5-phosphate isomerase RpiA [Actinomycetota bacterium]